MKPLAATLNLTNAVPKRVLQISEVLGNKLTVEHVCWKRFSRSNVDGGIFVDASSFMTFIIKLTYILFAKRYQILLFDDMRLLPLCVLISKLTRARLIYNRQEVPTIDAAQSISRRLHLRFSSSLALVERIETYFGRRVHAVLSIPLSNDGSSRLIDWGVPFAEVWNVPERLGIRACEESKLRATDEPATLIYSGAIAIENGLMTYLRLVRHLNALDGEGNVRLLLIGRLWKMSSEDIKAIIRDASCEKWVEYREWVPYDELTSLLKTADVGLAFSDPSYEKYSHMGEGSSRKIFTYMASGLPVVAAGAFGSSVGNAGFFVAYDDFNAQVEAVQNILTDSERAGFMGNSGHQAISTKYNWDIEQSKVSKIINGILG